MPNFFSFRSSLTRLLGIVSLLLATASIAQAQAPNILAFTPPQVLVNTATPAIITGTGFTGVTDVIIYNSSNVQVADITVGLTILPTTISFTVPALAITGTYNVQVTGVFAGLFGASNTLTPAFTVVNVLPVQLTSFTAESAGNSAQLRWATASEKNNDHFDVEASADGRTFARIGQVTGHGSTMLPQQYSFADDNLARYATTLVYYRLRQVDTDGTNTFSQVRTVAVATGGKPVLALYPTVATEGQATHFAYAGPELASGATLEIYSLAGQHVLTQPLSEVTGTIASKALASGWYWVRLTGAAPVRFYHQ